jgi:hypothetical protein
MRSNLPTIFKPYLRRNAAGLWRHYFRIHSPWHSKLCKLTPASIDKHLKILIQAGLVKVRTVGGVKKANLQTSKFKPTLDWFYKLSH